MTKTQCYSSWPEGLYRMSQEDQDKQFISDLQKYTELQASLSSVRSKLRDVGRNLKELGSTLETAPSTCSMDWSTFKEETAQVDGLVYKFQTELKESQDLADSLRKRRFTFPPSI